MASRRVRRSYRARWICENPFTNHSSNHKDADSIIVKHSTYRCLRGKSVRENDVDDDDDETLLME